MQIDPLLKHFEMKKASQLQILKEHLESGKEIDFIRALQDYGIGGGFRMRISQLRKMGLPINKRMQPFIARITGNPGEYAIYFLEK